MLYSHFNSPNQTRRVCYQWISYSEQKVINIIEIFDKVAGLTQPLSKRCLLITERSSLQWNTCETPGLLAVTVKLFSTGTTSALQTNNLFEKKCSAKAKSLRPWPYQKGMKCESSSIDPKCENIWFLQHCNSIGSTKGMLQMPMTDYKCYWIVIYVIM